MKFKTRKNKLLFFQSTRVRVAGATPMNAHALLAVLGGRGGTGFGAPLTCSLGGDGDCPTKRERDRDDDNKAKRARLDDLYRWALPDEILAHVASFLGRACDRRSQCAFALVSRRFRRIARLVFDAHQAFHYACRHGYADVVRRILADRRTDPAAVDYYRVPRIHGCVIADSCQLGNTDVVRLLLEDGRADPTADDNCALRMATWYGHTAVVRLLLADGRADPRAHNNRAIEWACSRGHMDIMQLLLADGRASPAASRSLIMSAIHDGNAGMLRMLLEDGRADPADGRNAAIRVCRTARRDDLMWLLLADRRADPAAAF